MGYARGYTYVESDMSTDKRRIGKENQQKLLFWLVRFGWLTARQIAKLVWPRSSQSLQNAQKKIAQLLKLERLIKRDLPSGSTGYVLSAQGANQIRSICPTVKSGKDLRVKNDYHRAISNSYLIDRYFLDAEAIYTEHEIQRGLAPCREVGGKIADGIYDTELGAVWVETENTWKSSKRTNEIVKFCQKYLKRGPLKQLISDAGKPELYLFRVEIVCPNDSSAQNIVRAFDKASGITETGRIYLDWEEVLSNVWIVRVDMSEGLVWGGEIWTDSVLGLIEQNLYSRN